MKQRGRVERERERERESACVRACMCKEINRDGNSDEKT